MSTDTTRDKWLQVPRAEEVPFTRIETPRMASQPTIKEGDIAHCWCSQCEFDDKGGDPARDASYGTVVGARTSRHDGRVLFYTIQLQDGKTSDIPARLTKPGLPPSLAALEPQEHVDV